MTGVQTKLLAILPVAARFSAKTFIPSVAMSNDIHRHIDELVKNNPVLLFMKGTRDQPQCGFSRQVVDVLNQLVADFATVDVLSNPHIREAIKAYSSWPTLPQLYVKGEFIGGCDIVLDLYNNNELQHKIGLSKAVSAPSITASARAQKAFAEAALEQPDSSIRLTIGANFEHRLEFDQKNDGDFSIAIGTINLIIDAYSASRAENLNIDFVEDTLEPGFAFKNPHEPPAVKELSVTDLASWRQQGKAMLLLDVRPKQEWLSANIDFAKLHEEMSAQELEALDKDMAIVFHCHHGGRSMRMAKQFRTRGFRNLYNLTGGIDAWAKLVDKDVPIY